MGLEKIKVTIDRQKWICGSLFNRNSRNGYGYTALLNDNGYMCCLGFVCQASGIDKDMLDIGEPSDLCQPIPDLVVEIKDEYNNNMFINTELTDKAMDINDNKETTPREKEELLKKLFADSIYELEFVGEYTHD